MSTLRTSLNVNGTETREEGTYSKYIFFLKVDKVKVTILAFVGKYIYKSGYLSKFLLFSGELV